MPSTARLFSKALFTQNVRRFWPILGAYSLIILISSFAFMMNLSYQKEVTAAVFIGNIYSMSELLSLIIALFSIVLAAAVFSYLYNSTAAAMVNALPYKRKTVYISNYLSGFFMLLMPLLIYFVILAGIGLHYNCLDIMGLLKWLLVLISLSVLLFSLAAVIGMFTGHIIAHMVFFAIANFIFIGLQTMIDLFFSHFLYGYDGNFSVMQGLAAKLTPILYASYLNFNYGLSGGALLVWAAYFLAGILLAWAGLILYQNRRMENAGDVVAIRKLNHLFKYGVTFCSSLAFGMILVETFNIQYSLLWLLLLFILTGAIGYFAAEMLLKKSYRVFYAYKGFAVYAIIITVLSLSVYNDWYGYAARLPQAGKVEAIAFAHDGLSYNALNNLQAVNGFVYIDGVPNMPDSLALTYGTPIERVENYDGGYRYIYKEAQNLSREELRLFWSLVPGIYLQDESLTEIYDFHEYLSKHIKEVRNNYRQRNTSAWYRNQENSVSHYNIKLIYRFDDGKTETYNFPVLIPKEIVTELDRDIYGQLAAIAGSPERRSKKIAAIDIPPAKIRHIYIDESIMQYSEKYPAGASSVSRPISMETTDKIKIEPEDYIGFINAWQTDYLTMTDEEMLKLNYSNWGYASFSLENLGLPPDNKFRDRSFGLDIDFNHKNTLDFLHEKGYITGEIYDYILEYSKSAANPEDTLRKISIAAI